MFVLCHNFGRRARAMARSIARRADPDPRIELNAFYNRPEDAMLLTEGALDGPAPPVLRLIPVSSDDILRRAMLFSQAHRMHDLSHTIFCDADVWFPPDFWGKYAAAVQGEAPGYWSCKVMDIPQPESKTLVDQWKSITRERLEQQTTGRRYDLYSGHVGHFQCIPRDLVPYPSDPMVGVSHMDLEFARQAIERSHCRRVERRIGQVCAYHLDHPHVWEGTGGRQL